MIFLKEIYNELKLNYPINTEAVVLAGGGSDLLLKVFKNKINSIAVDDDLYANAKGFKNTNEINEKEG